MKTFAVIALTVTAFGWLTVWMEQTDGTFIGRDNTKPWSPRPLASYFDYSVDLPQGAAMTPFDIPYRACLRYTSRENTPEDIKVEAKFNDKWHEVNNPNLMIKTASQIRFSATRDAHIGFKVSVPRYSECEKFYAGYKFREWQPNNRTVYLDNLKNPVTYELQYLSPLYVFTRSKWQCFSFNPRAETPAVIWNEISPEFWIARVVKGSNAITFGKQDC